MHNEAIAEAERLRREHPQRRRLVFAPRERPDGDWEVISVRPHGAELAPTNDTQRQEPARR
jgi:hypothetical protein